MAELSKSEYKAAKDVLRIGILRLHENWQKELADLLARPFVEEKENAFDRSLEITKVARDWYKELNRMEEWYHKTWIIHSIAMLFRDGTLLESDLASLSEEIRGVIVSGRYWD